MHVDSWDWATSGEHEVSLFYSFCLISLFKFIWIESNLIPRTSINLNTELASPTPVSTNVVSSMSAKIISFASRSLGRAMNSHGTYLYHLPTRHLGRGALTKASFVHLIKCAKLLPQNSCSTLPTLCWRRAAAAVRKRKATVDKFKHGIFYQYLYGV